MGILLSEGFIWSEKEEAHFVHNFFDLERMPFYYTLSAGNRTRNELAANITDEAFAELKYSKLLRLDTLLWKTKIAIDMFNLANF